MVEAHRGLGLMTEVLSPAAHEEWRSNGWTLVDRFLGQREVAALRGEADRLFENRDLFAERGAVPMSMSRTDRLDPVIDVSPPFAALARDPRLHELAKSLLGGDVQLLKDKFIAQPPGAIGYGTHQDAAYWPGLGIDLARFLTAILFIDDAVPENGAIECVAGSHAALLTDPDVIADPDESLLGPFRMIEARAGDLLLLHALTPHRSGPNQTDAPRRLVMFTYGVDPRPDLYRLYRNPDSAYVEG